MGTIWHNKSQGFNIQRWLISHDEVVLSHDLSEIGICRNAVMILDGMGEGKKDMATSANESKRFSYVKSMPCILKWGCRSSQLLQFAGFSIMICRHLAHCKYLAGPSTLVFLAGCKPPHFCCFFSYCSEQLAYIFHVPNKLKIILLSGIMF